MVVVEKLGEGGEVGHGEDEAEYLEAGLAAKLVLVGRTHGGGVQGRDCLQCTPHSALHGALYLTRIYLASEPLWVGLGTAHHGVNVSNLDFYILTKREDIELMLIWCD